MSMFQIKNRFSSSVMFECELTAKVAGQSFGFQLGFAVKRAIEAKANLLGANLLGANLRGANLIGADLSDADLSDADLSGANLRGADLLGADLRGANLRGANLSDADLLGANLSDADLSGANLSDADLNGANLSDADLSGANLSDADLNGADLSDADLSDANLRDADLSGANLSDADLSGANLRGANLLGANLQSFKQDLIAEVLRLPDELEALRETISAGKIDGSTYSGECACLAGTLAKARGLSGYQGETIEVGALRFTPIPIRRARSGSWLLSVATLLKITQPPKLPSNGSMKPLRSAIIFVA